MPRPIVWHSAEELAQLLSWERDALDRQIAALLQSRDADDQTARLEILLCKYVVEGSAAKAVDWATGLGWRLASVNRGKPSSRNWVADDLYDAIKADHGELPAPLIGLCKRIFYPNQARVDKWS